MVKLTTDNYKKDKYYPRVVISIEKILENKTCVTPIDVFISMELLMKPDLDQWMKGSIPYLERVIICNLSKASRILRLISFHCHDLNMKPSTTIYKGKRNLLRFTKTRERKIEEIYSRSFIVIQKK